MRFLANAISLIFHPLFLVYALVVLAYFIDRFGYYINDSRAIGAMLIMNFFLLVLFPAISIAMLVGLKMISGFKMEKREDRIAPLIITLSLYIWFFINVYNNVSYPDSLRFIALGINLTVGLAFFINNFTKISLHTIGVSSFTVGVWILLLSQEKSFIDIGIIGIGGYRVSSIFVLLLSVLVAGCVGSARLFLKAHRPQEVYGGYLIGSLAQIVAFGIIM